MWYWIDASWLCRCPYPERALAGLSRWLPASSGTRCPAVSVTVMVMRAALPVLDAPENPSAPPHLLPIGVASVTAVLGGWRGLRTRAA